MSSQELISMAASAECEITEYDNHYCIRSRVDFKVVVTVPKATRLVAQVVQKVKSILGL